MIKIFKNCWLFLLTGCCIFGVSYFWSAVLKPELESEPLTYSPKIIEATEKLRDTSFSDDDLYQVQYDVDYSEGESGRWCPKGESPILAELVEEGKLPTVADRVGPEPVVIKGVDGLGKYGGTWNMVSNSPSIFGASHHWMEGATLVRWSPLGYPPWSLMSLKLGNHLPIKKNGPFTCARE